VRLQYIYDTGPAPTDVTAWTAGTGGDLSASCSDASGGDGVSPRGVRRA
jgi:hypothetical protein